MDRSGSSVAERDGQVEAAILSLLLDFQTGSVWSVEEVVRELSATRLETMDALASLHGAGLLHRCGEFVFASRAASRFDRFDI